MKVLWQYLIKRIEVIVDAWGVYLQSIRGPSETICDKVPKRCPLAPILPDRDNLEAMVGDFFERHERLIQGNVPLPMQFVSTVAWFLALVFGICSISVDNYIDNIVSWVKNKAKVPPSGLETDGSE